LVLYDRAVRLPSVDHGVVSFLWSLLFFAILWPGMLAVGVSGGTAFVLSLVAAFGIFLLVRTRGEAPPS
jgi:hypothetical protein